VIGLRLRDDERANHDRVVAAMRGSLGESTFAAAWATGQTMPLATAIADALAVGAPGAVSDRPTVT
jgi:hypothetical protein